MTRLASLQDRMDRFTAGNEGIFSKLKDLVSMNMDLFYELEYDYSKDGLIVTKIDIYRSIDDEFIQAILRQKIAEMISKGAKGLYLPSASKYGNVDKMMGYFAEGVTAAASRIFLNPVKAAKVEPRARSMELLRKVASRGGNSRGTPDTPKARAALPKLLVDVLKGMSSKNNKLAAWVLKAWDLKSELETFEEVFVKDQEPVGGFFSYGGDFVDSVADVLHKDTKEAGNIVDSFAKAIVSELNKKLKGTAYIAGCGWDDTNFVCIATREWASSQND